MITNNGCEYFDDGLLPIKINKKGGDTGNIQEMVKIVKDEIHEYLTQNLKENDDSLYLGEKKIMEDDYVKSGEYTDEGTIVLKTTFGKEAVIEKAPKAIDDATIYDLLK